MTEPLKPTMFTMQKIERNGFSAMLIHFNADALYSQLDKTREEIKAFMAAEVPMPLGEQAGRCPCVIIDMSDIARITDGGDSILVWIFKKGASRDHLGPLGPYVVALINVVPSIMSLMRLMRFDEIFPIYENADSAMADICQHPSPKSKEEYFELLKKLTDLGSASRANRDNKPTSESTQG